MTPIDALSDIVMIKRTPPEDRTESGLFLAYDPDYREDIGEVVFVGRGKLVGCPKCRTEHRRKVDVRIGDKVLFSTNGHQIVKFGMEEFVVLREPSIMGVFE